MDNQEIWYAHQKWAWFDCGSTQHQLTLISINLYYFTLSNTIHFARQGESASTQLVNPLSGALSP
jgi:hypothetical protein